MSRPPVEPPNTNTMGMSVLSIAQRLSLLINSLSIVGRLSTEYSSVCPLFEIPQYNYFSLSYSTDRLFCCSGMEQGQLCSLTIGKTQQKPT